MKKMAAYLVLLFVVFGTVAICSDVLAEIDSSTNTGASIVDSVRMEHDALGNALGEGGSASLTVRIAGIVRALLSFIGVIIVVIVIYSGFLWLTAGGKEDQVKKAKDWLINAVIGAAIVLSAYAITDFVIEALLKSSKLAP
jgi:hypothetical protein